MVEETKAISKMHLNWSICLFFWLFRSEFFQTCFPGIGFYHREDLLKSSSTNVLHRQQRMKIGSERSIACVGVWGGWAACGLICYDMTVPAYCLFSLLSSKPLCHGVWVRFVITGCCFYPFIKINLNTFFTRFMYLFSFNV